jgi:hypothetical protein
MAQQLGRISGPLLSANLVRNKVDLAFESSLLYLNTTGAYLGINSSSPSTALTVGTALNNGGTGTSIINTVNLNVTTLADIANLAISGNSISTVVDAPITIQPLQYNGTQYTVATDYLGGTSISNQPYVQVALTAPQAAALGSGSGWTVAFSDQTAAGISSVSANNPSAGVYTLNFVASVTKTYPIYLHSPSYSPGNPQIVVPGIATANLQAVANTISSTTTNSDINVSPNGSGITNLNNNVLVSGSLHATGDITFDGDIQFGDAPTDLITILAEVNSDLLPDASSTYNLGSNSLKWNSVWANNLVGGLGGTVTVGNITVSTLTGGNVNFSDNNISAADGTSDISLSVSGTGKINMPNAGISIKTNTITTTPGLPLTIAATDTGYVKFDGTAAIVIGVGTTSQRPPAPETGTTRFNKDNGYVEVYSGTSWVGVNGNSPTLSQDSVNDVADVWALIFG